MSQWGSMRLNSSSQFEGTGPFQTVDSMSQRAAHRTVPRVPSTSTTKPKTEGFLIVYLSSRWTRCSLNRPRSNLLEEARRQYEAGNFAEAIIYLFSYQLVELDKSQLIRLAKGKTNRQYLREIGARPRLAALLNHTMIAFEDVFFGDHDLDRERFEKCWAERDNLIQQLEENAS